MRSPGPLALCLALVTASACNTSKSPPAAATGATEDAAAPTSSPPDAAPPSRPAIEAFDTHGQDETEALRAIGAMPAWEAAVRRGELLARRGAQGAVYGRLGGAAGEHRWLIDDTEGAGALGIHLSFDDSAQPLAPGQRLVAWGAWHVDAALAWYFRAERVATLPPREPGSAGAEAEPGHRIVAIAAPPEGAVPVSQRQSGPGDILFEVVRVPANPSIGWDIADTSRGPAVARLLLPGEQPSYGAQDYRTEAEHWRLARNVRYVVRIKRLAPPRAGALPVMTAIDAPRRIGAE